MVSWNLTNAIKNIERISNSYMEIVINSPNNNVEIINTYAPHMGYDVDGG